MARPESVAIDDAVAARLASDPTLVALMRNGVYFGDAPPGLTQYVLVSLLIATDEAVFRRRGYETVLYLVKAVELSTMDPSHVVEAAARIDELLEDQPLTIPNYAWMATCRLERVRYPERDTRDRKLKWVHLGGHYQVQAAPDWSTP